MINTKVRNNVVSWNSICESEISMKSFTKFRFSVRNTLLCSDDSFILSKIWHNIVSWVNWILCLAKISNHLFTQNFFRIFNIFGSVNDISIYTKIRDWVVDRMIRFQETWLSDWNLPWNGTSWWSEANGQRWASKKDNCAIFHFIFLI